MSEEEIKEVKEESEASRHNEQLLRMKADFENSKKRLEREKLDAIKYANERLLGEVLPIMDNLDRALASLSEGHDPEKVKKGLQLAQSELHQVLEQHGVQTVKALGEAFDPRFHEAMGIIESQDEEDGTILEEVQRGYLLNGRLIRPSRVRVSQKGSDKR